MLLPAATLSAIVLGLWLIILSVRVILARRGTKTSLGDGDNTVLARRIRAQANLCEYAPFGLILILLAELQGVHPYLLEPTAIIFIIGRLLHGTAFSFTQSWALGRMGGMILTFTGLILLIALLIISGISFG